MSNLLRWDPWTFPQQLSAPTDRDLEQEMNSCYLLGWMWMGCRVTCAEVIQVLVKITLRFWRPILSAEGLRWWVIPVICRQFIICPFIWLRCPRSFWYSCIFQYFCYGIVPPVWNINWTCAEDNRVLITYYHYCLDWVKFSHLRNLIHALLYMGKRKYV